MLQSFFVLILNTFSLWNTKKMFWMWYEVLHHFNWNLCIIFIHGSSEIRSLQIQKEKNRKEKLQTADRWKGIPDAFFNMWNLPFFSSLPTETHTSHDSQLLAPHILRSILHARMMIFLFFLQLLSIISLQHVQVSGIQWEWYHLLKGSDLLLVQV